MDPERFDPAVPRWAALRTAARWEKSLAALLATAGVPVYLPLMTRAGGGGKAARESHVPLFPGYLFCSEADFVGNPRVLPAVRAKVAQVMRPPDPDRLRDELLAVADLLTDRRLVQRRVVGAIGDVVEVVGGPLVGYRGPIVEVRPNRFKVVLEVSFLGARLEAEVDESLLRKVV